MNKKTLKDIEVALRKHDTKMFNKATKIINELTADQARFALLLMNQRKRGYLAMPDIQADFIVDLKRSKKARE